MENKVQLFQNFDLLFDVKRIIRNTLSSDLPFYEDLAAEYLYEDRYNLSTIVSVSIDAVNWMQPDSKEYFNTIPAAYNITDSKDIEILLIYAIASYYREEVVKSSAFNSAGYAMEDKEYVSQFYSKNSAFEKAYYDTVEDYAIGDDPILNEVIFQTRDDKIR